MINKVVLIGRLTRDTEVRTMSSGIKVANFTLAVDRSFKSANGEREADFIPIVVWRKTAELCEKYLSKGRMVGVIGRLQTRNYEGNDGVRRYVTEVVADEVQFLDSAGRNQGSSFPSEQRDSYKSTAEPDSKFGVPMDGFEEIDDLMPF